MGMFTEFYFRANIKEGEVLDWLHAQINGVDGGDPEGFWKTPPFDHPLFKSDRWASIFIGCGAVYQVSRTPTLERKGEFTYYDRLTLSSSLKDYGSEIEKFIDWITPHLKMGEGEYLGFSLYEDSADDSDKYREHPTLYFANRDAMYA